MDHKIFVPLHELFRDTGLPIKASGKVDWIAVRSRLDDWRRKQPDWASMRPSEKAMTMASWLPAAVRLVKREYARAKRELRSASAAGAHVLETVAIEGVPAPAVVTGWPAKYTALEPAQMAQFEKWLQPRVGGVALMDLPAAVVQEFYLQFVSK